MDVFEANIKKIYAYSFFMGLHFVGGVLVPFFTQWGQISFMQIMILQSWFMFCTFLFEIPTGTIADYIGRKHSLILGGIINVSAVLVYTSIPNFFIFMIGESLWALAQALISGANEALIYDTLKELKEENRSKIIFGRLQSANIIGLMISAPIGSFVAFYFGVRIPVLIMSVPFFIAFILAFTFKEPEIKEDKEERKRSYFHILKIGLKQFINNRILITLAIDMIVIGTVSFMMVWLYQPFLMAYKVDIAFFGIFHAIFLIIQVIIMNNFERLEKFFRSKKGYIFASSIITGIGFLLTGLIIFLPIAIIGMILAIGFGMTRKPLLINYMNKHIQSSERAINLSTVNMFQTFVCVIIYPFTGLLAEWSLNITCIILGMIAIVFAFISRVEENHLID
ncbi:MAG: MFS transporter [Candidatus Lokiarchaeota archaeon]|nr:MFS transporter [Candidatus Lokiarchaeota archaeon]